MTPKQPFADLGALSRISIGLLAAFPSLFFGGCAGSGRHALEGRKSSAEYLDMALQSDQADERRRGVMGLARSRDGRTDWAVKVYDTIARTDRDGMVRCSALRALAPCVGPDHVTTCLTLLVAPPGDGASVPAPAPVRWNAANLLLHAVTNGAFATEQRELIIDGLVSCIRHEKDPGTLIAEIEALGYFPERRVLDALIAALTDDNFTIAHTAERSLARLTGVTLHHDPDAWRDWLNSTGDPFASAGALPDSLADERSSKPKWDWLNWME